MGCKSSSSRAAPVLTSNNDNNNRSSRYSVPANPSNRHSNEPKRKRRTRSHSRRRSNEANSIEAQDALLARALQLEEDRQLVSLLQLQLFQSVENNNRANHRGGHRHHTRNEGLSTREIDRFPLCGNNGECEICMDEDPEGSFRMLPCMHSFHSKCIDPWLKKNRHCPHCQSDMRQVANLPEDEVMALSMRDV